MEKEVAYLSRWTVDMATPDVWSGTFNPWLSLYELLRSAFAVPAEATDDDPCILELWRWLRDRMLPHMQKNIGVEGQPPNRRYVCYLVRVFAFVWACLLARQNDANPVAPGTSPSSALRLKNLRMELVNVGLGGCWGWFQKENLPSFQGVSQTMLSSLVEDVERKIHFT
jgi:hypothetical protein